MRIAQEAECRAQIRVNCRIIDDLSWFAICWFDSCSRMKAWRLGFIPGLFPAQRGQVTVTGRKFGRIPRRVTLILVTDQDLELAGRTHYADLFRFALSLTKQEPDACDLTQESFYLLSAKGRQVTDTSKLKSWLFTTCYREFLRRERRRVRAPQVELSLVEEDLPVVKTNCAPRWPGCFHPGRNSLHATPLRIAATHAYD
jgi:hypothetical protein